MILTATHTTIAAPWPRHTPHLLNAPQFQETMSALEPQTNKFRSRTCGYGTIVKVNPRFLHGNKSVKEKLLQVKQNNHIGTLSIVGIRDDSRFILNHPHLSGTEYVAALPSRVKVVDHSRMRPFEGREKALLLRNLFRDTDEDYQPQQITEQGVNVELTEPNTPHEPRGREEVGNIRTENAEVTITAPEPEPSIGNASPQLHEPVPSDSPPGTCPIESSPVPLSNSVIDALSSDSWSPLSLNENQICPTFSSGTIESKDNERIADMMMDMSNLSVNNDNPMAHEDDESKQEESSIESDRENDIVINEQTMKRLRESHSQGTERMWKRQREELECDGGERERVIQELSRKVDDLSILMNARHSHLESLVVEIRNEMREVLDRQP